MPKPFHSLHLAQFEDLLDRFEAVRRIDSIHLHHTWRPNHADFREMGAEATMEAIHRLHTERHGWDDIGQHLTIDPAGTIWAGRDWNAVPRSVRGFNGNAILGPFVVTMIGDFDKGRDAFQGEQKEAAVEVLAALLRRFKLPLEAIRLHREMSEKCCPGSSIEADELLREVKRAKEHPRGWGLDEDELAARSIAILQEWRRMGRGTADSGAENAEPEEEFMDAQAVGIAAGSRHTVSGAAVSLGRGTGFTPEEKQILRQHVVNLRLGVFSEGGEFETSEADVHRIFHEFLPAELERRKAEGQPLRVVFYAHGGLVSEDEGIRPVLRRLPFWRLNGIYPIFFAWESGLKETLTDFIQGLALGQRGIADDAIDAALEFAASQGGRLVWSQMKRSAELASLPGGGARTVAAMARDFWNEHHTEMELHAVGHSAGAIFQSYFLPTLLGQETNAGLPAMQVKTLHFLAPAVTIALFSSRLRKLIGKDKSIVKHTVYTMNKDLERADTAGPYRKSLLHFVSNAFESERGTPLLGLQESLLNDPDMIRFYGLSRTIPGTAEILFSKTVENSPLDGRSESATHGDFDNDVPTMNSIARRILERPDGGIVSFVEEGGRGEVTMALRRSKAPAVLAVPAVQTRTGVAGRKRALCIGIDEYPAPYQLAGCVNDATLWQRTLEGLGFEVQLIVNQQASHQTILEALRGLLHGAQPGDVCVFQFAGHGTEVPDLDGDESSGKDQALVPADMNGGRFVIDDEIREIMQTIPAGVNVSCFMDCCYSGTNTRIFGPVGMAPGGDRKARFVPMTAELAERHREFRLQERQRMAARAGAPAPRTAETMLEVSFSACQPFEVAYESQGQGDFTRRATAALMNAVGTLSNQEFYDLVLQEFGPGRRQTPMLDCEEGSKMRLLLTPLVETVGGSGDQAILSRISRQLGDIERRLARLETERETASDGPIGLPASPGGGLTGIGLRTDPPGEVEN